MAGSANDNGEAGNEVVIKGESAAGAATASSLMDKILKGGTSDEDELANTKIILLLVVACVNVFLLTRRSPIQQLDAHAPSKILIC